LQALLSIWVLQVVYSNFRGQKKDARLKAEMLQAAVSGSVSRV